MESQRQLRDRLLDSEWEQTVAPWAAAKGLAEFEKYVVEKGREADLSVSWEVMQVRQWSMCKGSRSFAHRRLSTLG
jgi:hypothetical protein